MTEVFLDTSFAIALSSLTDQNHARAVELAHQLETNRTRLVTTQAILLEIGNALSKQRYRVAAIQLLESLEADPSIEIVLLTDDLYRLAFNLFKEREDKEWGLNVNIKQQQFGKKQSSVLIQLEYVSGY